MVGHIAADEAAGQVAFVCDLPRAGIVRGMALL